MHLLGLVLAVLFGITLRVIWLADIEWKADERWTFEHARQMLSATSWPWVGMPSSMGPPNPGLSLWVFAALSWLFQVESPPDLARAVQCLNCIAVVMFTAFAASAVPKERREIWLWAGA